MVDIPSILLTLASNAELRVQMDIGSREEILNKYLKYT